MQRLEYMQRLEHKFYAGLETFISAKKITLYRVAKDAGVTSAALYKLKSGDNEPSFYMLQKLAIAYPDLNLRWLLTGEGEMLMNGGSGGVKKAEIEVSETKKNTTGLKLNNR